MKESQIAFCRFYAILGKGLLQVLFEWKKNFCTLLYGKIQVQIFFRAELSFAEPKVLCI